MTRSIRFLLPLLLVFASLTALAQQAPLPGQLLLRLAKDADATRIEEQVAGALPAGVHVKEFVPLGEGSRYRKLVVDDVTVSIDRLRERMATVPGVEATHPNLPVQYRVAPNDPQYSAQWHMQSINVEPVWNSTTGGAMANGMRIAVGIVDTGVEGSHPDLADNMLIDFPISDDHGTEVAGVVGAVGNNNFGVTGVNWDVDLISRATVNDLGDVFTQFQFCRNQRISFNQTGGASGAMVVAVTASWGFVGVDCSFGEPQFDDLGAAGILVITAGPNDPTDIDVVPDYPSTCPNANNIVVTSIGPLGEIPFAVGNNTVHLLAPGLDIVTTTSGGGFATVDGNSFAIPHVAGAVALLYSNDCSQFAAAALSDPQGTALAVKDAILNSVTPVPGASALTITGGKLNVSGAFNLLNAQCATFCDSVTISFTNNEGVTDPFFVLNADIGTIPAFGPGSSLSTCLSDGCYSLQVMDDPVNQQPLTGTYTITGAGGVVLASGSYSGSIPVTVGTTIPGCTNPNFLTYDPDANCNDGSCCSNLATLTLNDSGGDGWEGATWTLTNIVTNAVLTGTLATGSTNDTTFCLPTGCYTFTVSSGGDDAEVSWFITGLNGGLEGGGADTTLTITAGFPITGCMDPAFCNYNPIATCPGQCLSGSSVELYVGGGDFPEEIGWTLLDGDGTVLLSGGGEAFHTLCLPPGCNYVMQMTDQFGDGWNGNFYVFTEGNGNITQGTLHEGVSGADTLAINAVSGCTDPLATNYAPLATCDDGTCCYGAGEIALLVDVFSSGEPVLWTLTDATQDTLASGGAGFDQHVCAVPACDHAITFTALDPPDWSGAAYTITATDGSWSTSRSIGQDTAMAFPVAVGNIRGCNDALANNFNPDATCDDGTCCYGAEQPVVFLSQPPGADSTWVLVDANDSTLYTSNGYFEQKGCLEPACTYTIILEDVAGDAQPSSVDVNDVDFNFVATAFADEGDSTATTFPFALVQGCTDPAANNYDPAAGCDNGTCCYGSTSLVVFSSGVQQFGWVVTDSTNTVVAAINGQFTQNVCIEPSCAYTITVTDSLADGFDLSLAVSDQATGNSFTLTPADGTTLTEPVVLGGTSGCTDPAASNFDPNAICDNGTCCLGTTGLLFVQPDDPFAEGLADVTITQGATTVFSGQLPLVFDDNSGVSYGQYGFCAADGCLSISISPLDVPLLTPSFLVLNGDFDNPVEFNTNLGLQMSIGGTSGPEVCDGVDNDCDGQVDEDSFWYADVDADGFGDPATAQFSCTPIPGLINTGGDCNDADANLTTAGAACDDGDPETVNDLVLPNCTCLGSVPGTCPPGEIEDCNGNCAPAEWLGDGFCDDGSFEWNGNFIDFACPAFANDGGDCGQPCTTEVCDGIDNDCDGLVDESGGTQWFIDTDGDGLGDPLTSQVSCTQPAGYVANPDDNCPALAGVQGDACDDGDPLTQDDTIDATCTCAGTSAVRVALKAWLEGPYDATTGRMRDDLRVAGSVPSAQPYTSSPFSHAGGEAVDPAVLTVADANDAIVDWVLVELRDAVAPATILHRRAALIQRDGDVVDTDGGSPVSFAAPGGSYHVALRHRNHFGVMTATAITLGGAPVIIDLTQPTTPVFGSNARKSLTGLFPAQAMWAGNTNPDGSLQYIGAGNDRDPILINVGSTTPNNVVGNTYSLRDVNLDGSVRYVGAANDRDPILINVGSTTPNNVRTEQLP